MATSKPTAKPQTVDAVAECERVLADLQDKRTRLLERRKKAEAETGQHAYAAHARGDKAALEAIDQVADRVTRIDLDLKAVDLAITEARARLQEARAADACDQDRAAALALREELQEFCKHGMRLDEALAVIAEAGPALGESLSKIHALQGAHAFPSHSQLDTLGYLALLTALRLTPWHKRFDPVPPNQRRNFTALVMGWFETIERDIAQRLGESNDEEAA